MGGAIILFGIVIPPRVGLTLEFAVALMLILLGLTNLRAVLAGVQATVSAFAVPATTDTHSYPHRHGDYGHSYRPGHGSHDHGHHEGQTPQAWLDRWFDGLGLYQVMRPLVRS